MGWGLLLVPPPQSGGGSVAWHPPLPRLPSRAPAASLVRGWGFGGKKRSRVGGGGRANLSTFKKWEDHGPLALPILAPMPHSCPQGALCLLETQSLPKLPGCSTAPMQACTFWGQAGPEGLGKVFRTWPVRANGAYSAQ